LKTVKSNRKRFSEIERTFNQCQGEEDHASILTVPETAAYLRVSESLIWAMLRRKELNALRLGNRVFFSRSYLDKFCEAK
jgi:excisionase family DNA binding protein